MIIYGVPRTRYLVGTWYLAVYLNQCSCSPWMFNALSELKLTKRESRVLFKNYAKNARLEFRKILKENSEVCARYTYGMFHIARKYEVSRTLHETTSGVNFGFQHHSCYVIRQRKERALGNWERSYIIVMVIATWHNKFKSSSIWYQGTVALSYHRFNTIPNRLHRSCSMTFDSRCDSVQSNGSLAACFIVVFGAVLLFIGPFYALVFLVLTMCISVISQEFRGRRRFRLAVEQRSSERPVDIESLGRIPAPRVVPESAPDLSSLVVRTFHKDDPMFTCEICLEDAQEGEEVASSSNKDCIHEFHGNCIRQALRRQQTCPCCRRDYLSPHDAVVAPSPSDQVIPHRMDSPTTVEEEDIPVWSMMHGAEIWPICLVSSGARNCSWESSSSSLWWILNFPSRLWSCFILSMLFAV